MIARGGFGFRHVQRTEGAVGGGVEFFVGGLFRGGFGGGDVGGERGGVEDGFADGGDAERKDAC